MLVYAVEKFADNGIDWAFGAHGGLTVVNPLDDFGRWKYSEAIEATADGASFELDPIQSAVFVGLYVIGFWAKDHC
jgi:hypothetical protein